jgi:NADPH2:quinone reductase
LKAATAKGSETTPYNLSNNTGGNTVENTANCYVVNAPGYYSLPLVYGNAIKNSATNASAYTSTVTGTNILNPFINHAGNGITDPYISGNGCTPAKAELAKAHGCDHVIDYTSENFTQRVRDITGGEGVPVVYDGVGKDTFMGSLDCLRPLGMMVSYGNASGPVPPVDLIQLSQKGSLFVTRPTLMSYTARREDLLALGDELFAVVGDGRVRIEVHQRYALADAAHAHRDLEARRTTGSTIFLP